MGLVLAAGFVALHVLIRDDLYAISTRASRTR